MSLLVFSISGGQSYEDFGHPGADGAKEAHVIVVMDEEEEPDDSQ